MTYHRQARRLLLASALATGLPASALPAFAQSPNADRPDEIVVTGERRDSTVFETGSSVVVTTPVELELFAGPDTLDRIFDQTANVSTTGSNNQGPTIRGANTSGILTSLEGFFGGSQPRTTVQLDGRQLSFNEFVFSGQSAWDIARVEIFRGPQTTTQGRNAISGAVFIETARPDFDTSEARLRLRAGNRDLAQVSGSFNGQIGEDLALRLSGDFLGRDVDVERIGITTDIGTSITREKTTNLRGRLLWEPRALDGLSALLTVSHTDSSRPQTDSVDAPFDLRQRQGTSTSVFQTNTEAAVADVTYQAGLFTLRNVATVAQSDVERLDAPGAGNALIDNTTYTNETTLALGTDRIDALAGLYLSQIDSDETLDLGAFGIGAGDFADDRSSVGLFAQAVIGVTDRLEGTLGLRYQRDSQDRDGGFAGVIPIDFDQSFDAWLPRAELAYAVTDDVRLGVMAERGFNAGGFTFNFDTFTTEEFADETVWNYEVFARTRLLDGRLRLNANAFYSDFDDLQIASLVQLGPDFFANIFSNAPSARTVGAEIELDFAPVDDLRILAGAGYADTEYTSDSLAGAPLDGNAFQRSPDLTLTGGIAWTPGAFDLSAFGRYSDGYFSDDANLAANRVDSFATLDLQAGYSFGDRARIYGEVVNVFDDDSPVFVFDSGQAASLLDSREIAVGVEVAF